MKTNNFPTFLSNLLEDFVKDVEDVLRESLFTLRYDLPSFILTGQTTEEETKKEDKR